MNKVDIAAWLVATILGWLVLYVMTGSLWYEIRNEEIRKKLKKDVIVIWITYAFLMVSGLLLIIL